jgi:hypothetical protein
MKITLVRQMHRQFTEHERRTAAYVLFGGIDGLTDDDKRAWRRFISMTMRLMPGEMSVVEVKCDRVAPMHRRHMLLESRVFKAQETFETFEAFRDWLKTGSAFVEWQSRDGQLTPVPKSMSWTELPDEIEFRHVHDNMVKFLRTERACQKLWPHLTPRAGLEMIEGLMKSLDE